MNIDDLIARMRDRRDLPPPPVRRLIREQSGLVQRDIAEVLGRSRPAITRWESGRRTPRGEDLAAYRDLLDRLAAEMAAR